MAAITNSGAFAIGELSRRTGVHIETIRFYERIGILAPARRTRAGRRTFGGAEARSLSFVRRARELGFSLDEIRALLSLEARASPCAEVHEIAARHLADVRARIADLRRLETILADTVSRCSDDEAAPCPVLEMIEGGARD